VGREPDLLALALREAMARVQIHVVDRYANGAAINRAYDQAATDFQQRGGAHVTLDEGLMTVRVTITPDIGDWAAIHPDRKGDWPTMLR